MPQCNSIRCGFLNVYASSHERAREKFWDLIARSLLVADAWCMGMTLICFCSLMMIG